MMLCGKILLSSWIMLAIKSIATEIQNTLNDVTVCNSNNDHDDLLRNTLVPRIVTELLQHYRVNMSKISTLDISKAQLRKSSCLITHGAIQDLIPGDHAWGIGVKGSNDRFSFETSSLHLYAVRGEKTRSQLQIPDGITLGDPLVLSTLLLKNISSHCTATNTCRYSLCNVLKNSDDDIFSKFKIRSKGGNKKTLQSDFTFLASHMPLESLMECKAISCSSVSCAIVGLALGFPSRYIIPLFEKGRNLQMPDFLTSTLGPYGEELSIKLINTAILKKSQAALLKSFPHQLFPKVQTFRVFLDHGGLPYHAEVFFSIATLVMKKYSTHGLPTQVVFMISHSFAKNSGLKEFWERYSAASALGAEVEWVDIDAYYLPVQSHEGTCGTDAETRALLPYDLRVVVTIPTRGTRRFRECYSPIANRSDYMIIIHRPHYPEHRYAAIHWNNTFVASQSNVINKLIPTERMFTPSLMPIQPQPPNCLDSARPVVVVQGAIATKRVRTELHWLLSPENNINITVRILTRQEPPLDLLEYMIDGRMEYLHGLNMVSFHEAFLGAAFIMPLIMPGDNTTMSYLQGHPTSSIAYGSHFRLRFIGHKVVHEAYKVDMLNRKGYWHDGTERDFIDKVRSALVDFFSWCATSSHHIGSTGEDNMWQ